MVEAFSLISSDRSTLPLERENGHSMFSTPGMMLTRTVIPVVFRDKYPMISDHNYIYNPCGVVGQEGGSSTTGKIYFLTYIL